MAVKHKAISAEERPVVLIVCDYYLPGFESGGAMRTLVNMVDRLSDEFDFRIITRDHDGPLNRKRYDNIQVNAWNIVNDAAVYYLSRERIRPFKIRSLIKAVRPDAIYVNSFFSPLTFMVLLLYRLRTVGNIHIVLAPEGEFSSGAIAIKGAKKQLYIKVGKSLRLFDDLVWKAAAASERADINRVMGSKRNILIAANLPPVPSPGEVEQNVILPKAEGSVKMVFLSRYMRKKNFNWLFEHLCGIKGELRIDICGPIEEIDYADEARRLIDTLPDNVTINWVGPVPHAEVARTLANYHFFILPTLGENFGHVFVEALSAGCPLITSDRTPWRDLEAKGIGWDLPLEEPGAWGEALNKCLNMDNEAYMKMSGSARRFAHDWLSDPALEESNRQVLRSALAKTVGDPRKSGDGSQETTSSSRDG